MTNDKPLTPRQEAIAQNILDYAERNYERGGDQIVECLTLTEIHRMFPNGRKKDARRFCGAQAEQALNQRFGDDDDPQLAMAAAASMKWVK